MPSRTFDDAALRAAMQSFLWAAQRLDDAAGDGLGARELLDLAEAKSVAGMELRKRLVELGWTAPGAAVAPAEQPPARHPADQG